MSQDLVLLAVQSCAALIKEVQRRVDALPTSAVDSELRQYLKLAKATVERVTRKDAAPSRTPPPAAAQAARKGGDVGGQHSAADAAAANARRGDIFKSAPLWAVVLCSFYWNKRKLSDQALDTLQALLRCREADLQVYTTLFLSPYLGASGANSALGGMARGGSSSTGRGSSDKRGGRSQRRALCRAGEGVFVVLADYLSAVAEPTLQARAFHILQGLVEGKGQAFFVGKCVARTIHAAFTVALQTSQETMRTRSQNFLLLCVVRVTKGFVVESTASTEGTNAFQTATQLEDYTVDVEYDAPYTRIVVGDQPQATPAPAAAPAKCDDRVGANSPPAAAAAAAAAGSPPSRPPPLVTPSALGTPPSAAGSYDPSSFFPRSLDQALVRDAIGVLNREMQLPPMLKDMLLLLRHICKLSVRPITGAAVDGNADVRARLIALRMLERVFHELPVANAESEHRCATWLALVLTACKYDLVRALVRNLSTVTPFSFFEASIAVLTQMVRKCHYPLARELHTLFAVFLLPLASSSYSNFRQKHAVLSMIHELFGVPHLCISLFINYDSSPTFDAGGVHGGVMEMMIEFVTDLTFADHVAVDGDDEEDWLNSDQQQLLRSECIVALHALVTSLHRWISEDPRAYALSVLEERYHGVEANARRAHGEWGEVYLDNWSSDSEQDEDKNEQAVLTSRERAGDGGGVEEVPHHEHSAVGNNRAASPPGGANDGQRTPPLARRDTETASSTAFDTDGLVPRNTSIVVDQDTGTVVSRWGKHRNIRFHWKHVHYLLHNKRIALDAVEMINCGKWKEAKAYLEDRQYIPYRHPTEYESKQDLPNIPPGESSYAELARFISEYPGISREAISGIFDRINKDFASRLVLRDYLHLIHYHGVPIDVAMRDTTCKFMSWDRPMFEAQVWEAVQACFGDEYAAQNPAVITAKDADTMAGVLLFLHSNLHNENARGSRFNVDQFIIDANACVDIPMEEKELRAIFLRVQQRKWELDEYGRTPSEAEHAAKQPRFSLKIMTQSLIREQSDREGDKDAASDNAPPSQPQPSEDEADSRFDGAPTKEKPPELVVESGVMVEMSANAMDGDNAGSAPASPFSGPSVDETGGETENDDQPGRLGENTSVTNSMLAGTAASLDARPAGDAALLEEVPSSSDTTARLRDMSRRASEVGGRSVAAGAAASGNSSLHGSTVTQSAVRGAQPGAPGAAASAHSARGQSGVLRQQPTQQSFASSATASFTNINNADVALLDSAAPSYRENKDAIKLREVHHIAFTEVAALYAAKLETVHRIYLDNSDNYHPQPYVVPHYAEHVRPILLSTYPQIMACVYMGCRVIEAVPLSRQMLDVIQVIYDVAAAFVMNLGDLRAAVTEALQRCLAEDSAYKLMPPTRATFVPYLLNAI